MSEHLDLKLSASLWTLAKGAVRYRATIIASRHLIGSDAWRISFAVSISLCTHKNPIVGFHSGYISREGVYRLSSFQRLKSNGIWGSKGCPVFEHLMVS